MKNLYFLPTAIIFLLILALNGYSQNVGVGENSPATKLEIKGDAGTDLLNVKDQSNNSRLYIQNSGNVGIGTINPGAKLQVAGGSATATSILTDGYVEDVGGIVGGNYVPSHSWDIGTGSVGIFNANQTTSGENEREWGIGPHGYRAILWKAIPSGDSNADGGWNSSTFEIDHTKSYRLTIWIKKTGDNDGSTYFGCLNTGDTDNQVRTMGGSATGNPYFWSGDLPELDKWYLLVGYIHGSGDPSTTSYGGIYDSETGAKVISMNDFKFPTTATIQRHRTYLYYNGNTTNRQYFWGPRFEEVNGKEPSIAALLGLSASTSDGDWIVNINDMYNANSGNVGIGSTTPTQKLEIGDGNIQMPNNYGIYFTGNSLGSDAARLYTTSSSNRLLVRSEDVDGIAEFSSYGMYLPRTGQSYNLYLGGSLKIGHAESGLIDINDANTRLREGSNNAIRLQTNNGYVDVGAQNGSHAHIYSDMPSFYFNKPSYIGSGNVLMNSSGNSYISNGQLGVNTSGPTQTLDVNGQVRIRGGSPGAEKVLVSDANGVGTWSNALLSKPKVQSFTIGGSNSTFYPVVFDDPAWNDGPMVLEISRPDVHTDGSWAGSLISRFTTHSSSWGHGSDFVNAEIRYGTSAFIAGYQNHYHSAKFVVWLRGGRTYHYRSNSGVTNVDFSATNKTINGVAYNTKTSIDSYVNSNGTRMDDDFHVAGRIQSLGILETSDLRFKRNVERVTDALSIVNGMNGVYYDWKHAEFPAHKFENIRQIGVIAQEVEKVLPEVVQTNEAGYKSVEYSHIVPVLIEAIKELKAHNDQLKAMVEQLITNHTKETHNAKK